MLTDRQLLILQTIIDEFIETAHPIGSRALSTKPTIDTSAAIIRNAIVAIEDMGLLDKTHSSSGMLPSEKGYRYYVDRVISPTLTATELHLMQHIIQGNLLELEQVVQLSADLLLHLT